MNIEALYVLKGEYIDGKEKAIDERYGSFEKFLSERGINEKDLKNIRKIILQ